MKTNNKIPQIIGYVLILAVVGMACFFAGRRTVPASSVTSTGTQSIRENDNKYEFIHPLLAVNRIDMDIPSASYISVAKDVQDFINQEKATGALNDTSVYFIDYQKNGGSFALNENDAYAPASMLKVVIMIGYLKESDSDPTLLSQSFVYNVSFQESIKDLPFESPTQLQVGQSYTVNDLIKRMIVDSDNGAMNVLLGHIDDSYLSQVYQDLGLTGPGADGTTYSISAKDYSLFLRILYNSTYLSREGSEKALSLMSQATFKDGLAAGLPAGTVVAHKYGERVLGNEGQVDSVELHDCGFVYSGTAPYLLCVMTKSKTLDESKKVISNISHIIYTERQK